MNHYIGTQYFTKANTKNNWLVQRLAIIFLIFLYGFVQSTIAYAEIGRENQSLVKLENDLIIETDKLDELIYKRGAQYVNEEVSTYINKVGNEIILRYTNDNAVKINIKMIRDPLVNAFAMPNGAVYIHTGALAKLENEAQLAFLLAHEISHVVNKDSIYDTQSRRGKTVTFKLLDIVLAPTSVFFGFLGDLAQAGFALLYVSTVTGYGRNIEARADKDGILWVSELGYHPKEAASLIEIFLKEKDKYQTGAEVFFLMNHPSNQWRLNNLKKIVSKKYGIEINGMIKQDEFLHNMVAVKLYNAELNIKMDRLCHAEDNISWVLDKIPEKPEAHFLMGEIYRLKAEDKDKLYYEVNQKEWNKLKDGIKNGELEKQWRCKAMEEYKLAIKYEPNYADSYKGLGLLYYGMDDDVNALANLQKYLELNSNAEDERYIRSYIKRINGKNKGKDGKV